MVQGSGAHRCLTFELSGPRRVGVLAARPMINSTASRPVRQPGGGPLERRVRRPASRQSAPVAEVTTARPAFGWPPLTGSLDSPAFRVMGEVLVLLGRNVCRRFAGLAPTN